MNERIQALYKEATGKDWAYDFNHEVAEKFAALVAAAEREACAKAVEVFDKTFQTGGVISGTIRRSGEK